MTTAATTSDMGGDLPAATPSEWFSTDLKRTIGKRALVLFVIGDIIGGGIYSLIGVVGGDVGGAIWAPFALAFVLALLTAASYAELITKYPRAGGAAVFIRRAYRSSTLAFVTGVAVLASGLTSAATLATAFGGQYFQTLIDAPQLSVSLGFIAVVAAVNLRGIKESVAINVVLTLIEVGGLLLIAVVAGGMVFNGDAEPSRAMDFIGGESIFLLVLSGAALAFYSFVGFEDTANLAEEVEDPSRVYPRALLWGLGIAGCIYMLITVLTSMAVPTSALAASDGPLLEVIERGSDIPLKLFAVIGLFAVANGALINMVMSSRLLYGMSRENLVPGAFGRILGGRRTPYVAILFTTVLAAILISTGDIATLASTTSLLLLCVFILVNGATLLLRREDVEHDHFRAPTIVPALGILVCAGLLTQQEGATFGRAGILVGIGLVLWAINLVWDRWRAGQAAA
ncbi:MAG: amino acid permease-associated region [Thermoleophilia bacterium]|nr:amino acid permease-associated region [Thermoleophilia bacterium]